MPNTTIKPSTITRAGYEYQDLVGIEALIKYYRNPGDYLWVQLEADDTNTSLDDVVVARADGSFEYIQVKFTVSADDYRLDWKWLTEKLPRGTSKLTKWETSLRKLEAAGAVHSASLRTNRVPDAELAKLLVGGRLDLDAVEAETRSVLELHCGGAARAKTFFDNFEFVHSERDLDAYEAALRDELVGKDIEASGWLYLRDQVRGWTMRRNLPPPDGRILHDHLQQVISRQRPQPIRQDFRVPKDYILPSATFDAAISQRVASGSPLTIVWGTPGRGKSTYLSYLAEKLRKAGSAVVRHHYFLAMDDTTPDRLSFSAIEASLINQIFLEHPDLAAGMEEKDARLRPLLERAANALRATGQPLYVFVDGLDHVWRDSARTDQLDQLFNHLLPLPDNVFLLVGTQRVPDGQLPKKLVRTAKANDWIEIPAMDEVAVAAWVKAQDDAKRVITKEGAPERRAEAIDQIAASFFRISGGHPLHLIFAFESLASTNRAISAEDVDALPPCPDGDIRTYYATLWSGLSDTAQNILHALSGTGFHWPGSGVRICFGTYDEIGFLLEARHSGLLPFHDSIFAFVRERTDHSEAYQSLLPRIISWLENDAPDFWRWGWLWLTKAAAGDSDDLVNRSTRTWVVDSLAAGWPQRQMVSIFRAAERAAFDRKLLARTVEIRWLKVRLLNAKDYQSTSYGNFQAGALVAGQNWQQLKNLTDDMPSLSEDELVAIAAIAVPELRTEIRDAAIAELRRRVNVWIELRHRPEQEFLNLTRSLLHAVGEGDGATRKRVLRFLKGFNSPRRQYGEYIDGLGRSLSLEGLLELDRVLRGDKWASIRRAQNDEIARTAGYLEVDLTTRISFDNRPRGPLLAAWYQIRHRDSVVPVLMPDAPKHLGDDDFRFGRDGDTQALLHSIFFSALANGFAATGDFSLTYPAMKREGIGWLSVAIEHLESVAQAMAAGTVELSFSSLYVASCQVDEVLFLGNSNEADYRRYVAFRQALRKIARDLHAVSRTSGADVEISVDELATARASVHWIDEPWLSQDVEDQRRYLSHNAAEDFLMDEVQKLSTSVTVFNERADAWTQLAGFSIAYSLGLETKLIARAADCLMGYGYRKDLGANDVLDAVKEVHLAGGTDALSRLQALVPIVEQVTTFTDGDETDHVRSKLIEVLARTHPEKLPAFYGHYISGEEWRYADECLEELFGVLDFGSDIAALLIATLADHQTMGALEKAALGNPYAAALAANQVAFLGGQPIDRHERSGNDGLGAPKPAKKPPISFGASNFALVAKEVGKSKFDFRLRRAYLSAWLDHWVASGKGKAAISSIDRYFDSGQSTYNVDDVLDDVFQASLSVEGKKAAYKWLVRAHIHRNGWASYWSSEDEVMRRLELAATLYPAEWWTFIVDTSQGGRHSGKTLSLGQKYLVRFLTMAGRVDVADEITGALVGLVVAEVEDQPIPEAPWFV